MPSKPAVSLLGVAMPAVLASTEPSRDFRRSPSFWLSETLACLLTVATSPPLASVEMENTSVLVLNTLSSEKVPPLAEKRTVASWSSHCA